MKSTTLFILKSAVFVCFCIFLICAAGFMVELQEAARKLKDVAGSAKEATDKLSLTVADAQKRMDGTFQNLNALLIQAGLAADEVRRTSLEERSKVAAFSSASIQAVTDLDLVARDGAAAVQTLQGAVAELGGTAAALRVDAEAGKSTIAGATQLLGTLNAGSANTFDEVDKTVGHVDQLVVDAKPIERHVDDGTKYLAQTLGFIWDDFSPKKKSFWVRLLDTATSGMFSVVLHWLPQRVEVVK